MKYKNRFLLISICLMQASGCTLESPLDGEACADADHPVLSEILLDGVWCHRDDCPSANDCCNDIDIDPSLRKSVYDAFDYNICPKGSEIATCFKDSDNYYCSKGCPANLSTLHIASCENGISHCIPGFGDCDGDILNGCESNLSELNMIACENGQPTCMDGYADCNDDVSDGCEINLTLNHAVACDETGLTCEAGYADCDRKIKNACEFNLLANHVLSCDENYQFQCEEGYVDCDNKTSNGCEFNLNEKNAVSCQSLHVSCKPGWGNCNQRYLDGCETSLLSSPNHCGQCDKSCNPDEECNRGICELSPCSAEYVSCGTEKYCVSKVLGHLEACDNNFNHGMLCKAGYDNCNDIIEDGCETHIAGMDSENCGACGQTCSKDQILGSLATTCHEGSCEALACEAGYQLSNGTCVACKNGEYGANGICTKCPAGTHSHSSRTECIPCEAGEFSLEGSRYCTACAYNQISTAGSGACVECGLGTSANNDHTTCVGCSYPSQCTRPNGVSQMTCDSEICKAASCEYGFYLSNGICLPCQAGTYSYGGTARSCTKCRSGFISSAGQHECTPCKDGYYTKDNITCLPCQSGTSTSGSNHTSCINCKQDEFSTLGSGCRRCPEGMHSTAGSDFCSACISNDHCALPVGAKSTKCVNKTCQIEQCAAHYYLHNNRCYPLNADYILASAKSTEHCITTSDLCINNYINWTTQFCHPGDLIAFNFDNGINVTNNTSNNPKPQIYYENNNIKAYTGTQVALVEKGSSTNAFEHLLKDDECKNQTNYGSSIAISTASSNACATSIYSVCVKTTDSTTHTEPYYYSVLFYVRYNDTNYGFMLWRKLDD